MEVYNQQKQKQKVFRVPNRLRSGNGSKLSSKSFLDFVGNTRLIQLNSKEGELSNFEAKIYAKVEYVYPSGSIKDQIVKFMIEQAEKIGNLKAGETIIEASSGNTGIDRIGDGFIPSIVDQTIIDDSVNVKDEDAVNWSRILANKKGLFECISSRANVQAAAQIAKKLKKGQNVVTLFPDSQNRYASPGIFSKKTANEIHVPKTFAP